MQRIGKVVVLPSISRVSGHQNSLDEEDEHDQKSDFLASLAPLLSTPSLADLPSLPLPSMLEERLMDHQVIGVRWLHSLYLSGSGGILGDDMGLGKTFQVICLLAGLMKQQLVNKVLILAPVSVLPNWQRELMEHLVPHIPSSKVFLLNSDRTKKKRLQMLETTFQQSVRGYSPKVVISSYHLVSNMVDDFANNGRWDYVILDEGHVIKNPSTKISKSMHQLSSHHRLILTGTPIQNNLNEFWAIANWATKGKRFGTLSGFKEDFSIPIVHGQDPKASPEQRMIAEEAAKNLLNLTKPILLQRKKCELPSNDLLQLPEKIELVVWSPLATSQRELYEQFVDSRQFSIAVNRSTCPVEVINHLKTVCRHPLLIEALEMNRKRRELKEAIASSSATPSRSRTQQTSQRASTQDEEDEWEEGDIAQAFSSLKVSDSAPQPADNDEDGELGEVLSSLPANASVFDVVNRKPDAKELLRGSIKLRILLKLVHRLHFAGHRMLIFSQSRLMLDIIQFLLVEYGLASHRIDGSVKSAERQRIIDEFNDQSEDSVGPSICMLTTKACGFGITLTGADRVIIYDPSWNPAEDRQAVDRAYRIGQTKNVVVYRLIMASSVEEKMYEKQVFKDGIRVVTESGTSSRYFSRDETTELFKLGPVDQSVVMERLWAAAGQGSLLEFPDTRGALPSVLGYTRHDTLYSEVRAGAASHGQDAYAQFVDPIYVASDAESEDEHFVPATPAPKRATAPKTPHTASKLPFSMLSQHNSGKENERNGIISEPTEVFDLISPPRRNPHNRNSMACDLTQQSPGPSRGMQTPEVFQAEYNALRNSKLYRASLSPVRVECPEAPDQSDGPDTEEHQLGSSDPTASRDESGAECADEDTEAESAEEESTEAPEESCAWDAYELDSFIALRDSKLHRSSVSPSKTPLQSPLHAGCRGGNTPELPPSAESSPSQDDTVESIPSEYCLDAINQLLGEFDGSPVDDSEHHVDASAEVGGEDYSQAGNFFDTFVQDEALSQECVPPELAPSRHEADLCEALHDCVVRPGPDMQTQQFADDFPALFDTPREDTVVELSSAFSKLIQINGASIDGNGHCDAALDADWDALGEVDESSDGSDSDQDCEAVNDDCDYQAEVPAESEFVDKSADNQEAVIQLRKAVQSPDVRTCEGAPVDDHIFDSSQVSCSPATENVLDTSRANCSEGIAEEGDCSFFSEEEEEIDADHEFPSAINGYRESVSAKGRGGYLLNLCEMGSMKRSVSNGAVPVAASEDSVAGTGVSPSADAAVPSPHCNDQSPLPSSAPPAGDSVTDQFASPSTPQWNDNMDRRHTGGITVRKSRNPHQFSTYMEPDLFASPQWMAPSMFSPPLAPAAGVDASAAAGCCLVGTPDASPLLDPTHCSTDSSAQMAAEGAPPSPRADDLSDLVASVKALDIATKAAPCTPMSKISFQTSTGVLSSMIVKAQSVNRSKSFFAELSDSENDNDDGADEGVDGEECSPNCDQDASAGEAAETVTLASLSAGPQTPLVSHNSSALKSEATATVISRSSCGRSLQNSAHSVSEFQQDFRRTSNVPSEALSEGPEEGEGESQQVDTLPCAALFDSPGRRSSVGWPVASPLSDLSTSRDTSFFTGERESPVHDPAPDDFQDANLDVNVTYDGESAVDDQHLEDHVPCASSAATPPLTPSLSPTSQTSRSVRYDAFSGPVVEDLQFGAECIAARTARLLRALQQEAFNFPVNCAHVDMTIEEVSAYNACLAQARAKEAEGDSRGAADLYKQALGHCDEDPYLHGKLAYLLQALLGMFS